MWAGLEDGTAAAWMMGRCPSGGLSKGSGKVVLQLSARPGPGCTLGTREPGPCSAFSSKL